MMIYMSSLSGVMLLGPGVSSPNEAAVMWPPVSRQNPTPSQLVILLGLCVCEKGMKFEMDSEGFDFWEL